MNACIKYNHSFVAVKCMRLSRFVFLIFEMNRQKLYLDQETTRTLGIISRINGLILFFQWACCLSFHQLIFTFVSVVLQYLYLYFKISSCLGYHTLVIQSKNTTPKQIINIFRMSIYIYLKYNGSCDFGYIYISKYVCLGRNARDVLVVR